MINYIFLATAIFGLLIPTNIYLVWIKELFGRYPTSYSGTYGMLWDLSHACKPIRHLTHIFTAWTGMHSALLLPALVYYSDTTLEIIMSSVALLALVFVGLFPTSVSKDVTTVHCICAKLCALDAIVWLFLKGIYAPTLVLCIGGYIWSKGWQKKYETTIMEYMAFTSAYVGVIVCALKSLGLI